MADSQFFVLSSGRSGSQTVAYTLSQSPECLCLHEPHPQLVRESALYAYGKADVRSVMTLVRESRSQLGRDCTVYGETNNRLSLMADALVAAFPNAKYVWLVRDGRDFVASELQRGAYQPPRKAPWATSKWDRWRLDGSRVGAVTPHDWNSWGPFEKTAWQWQYVNDLVGSALETLPAGQKRVVRIEDWASDVQPIASWLGLESTEFAIPRANRRSTDHDSVDPHPRHPNRVAYVSTWRSWDDVSHERFVRLAGSMMDRHYPGWREPGGGWSPAGGSVPESDGAVGSSSVRATQLGEARVRAAELQSELDALRGDPYRLLLTLLGAARRTRSRPRP